MENPRSIEVCVLTTRKMNPVKLLEIIKENFSDRVEYYEGCAEVQVLSVTTINKKNYYRLNFLLDDHIGTELYGLFSADIDDEVSQMHGMTSYLREGIAQCFDSSDEWVIFKDDFCTEFCRAVYEEIADLENSLRGALNMIFASATGGFNNYFDDSSINTISDYHKESAVAHQQNELHYLSFSDYSKAADSKTPNVTSLIAGLKNAQNFTEFKGEVFPVLVREEKHLDFMASLKQIMDSLEKMRNSIAHNRMPSSTLLENYIKSRADLRSVIADFWTVQD